MIYTSEAIKNAVARGETSYRRLAKSTGYDHAFLHSIAQGKKKPPANPEFYEALANALDLRTDDFAELARIKLDEILDNNKEAIAVLLKTAKDITADLKPGETLVDKESIALNEGLIIDVEEYTAYINGAPLDFTFTEFQIMAYLYKHSGKTLTREAILREVWGYSYLGDSRTIDVHIRRIRAKLGPRYQDLVETVRNIGYRLTKGTL